MKRNKSFILIALIAFFSFGFIMEFQWPWMQPKKEAPKANSQNQNNSPKQTSTPTAKSDQAPVDSMNAPVLKRNVPASGQSTSLSTGVSAVRPDIEMNKIQEQLRTIIDQTKAIQNQGQIDRAKLKGVVDQVNVQKRLAESLKAQKTIVPQTAGNTEEILRNTKIRILADEVAKTRSTLDAIKPVPVQNIPKVTKPVPVQENQKSA